MLVKKLQIKEHPLLGDLDLDFTDSTGAAYPTVIFAGANGCGKTVLLETIQRILEGGIARPIQVDMEVSLDATNLDQLRKQLAIDLPETQVSMHASYAGGAGIPNGWKFTFIGSEGRELSASNRSLIGGLNPPIFRSFLNEANVNFVSREIASVTTLQVDQADQPSTRSGNDLAYLITQLLIDIRAADGEDLQRWVEKNTGEPPKEVVNKRMKRFVHAFEFMFPRKRFRTISRNKHMIDVEFEENGRISNINQLSTGEKQIVFRGGFILQHLSQVQSGLLLVDEPELSLHPEWQSRILGFYHRLVASERSTTQLFVATHSPLIVHDAPKAKVIILEKDQDGQIKVMPEPIYPAPGGNLAIAAFNIDSFLATAKYNLLVLAEGDTDVSILETAWEKLHSGEKRYFELRSALGAKNISITLNDSQLFAKAKSQKIVGIVDFDEAYNQWNGIWAKTPASVVVANESECITKRHATQHAWAMLLPVPSHRSVFASRVLGGRSILSIEFLFQDADIPAEWLTTRAASMGNAEPVFRERYKKDFSEHVKSLPKESFAAFESIFERWKEIADGKL